MVKGEARLRRLECALARRAGAALRSLFDWVDRAASPDQAAAFWRDVLGAMEGGNVAYMADMCRLELDALGQPYQAQGEDEQHIEALWSVMPEYIARELAAAGCLSDQGRERLNKAGILAIIA